MESEKFNYKKVFQWTVIIIGMVVVATFIAVVIFFSSIPENSADKRVRDGQDFNSPTKEMGSENNKVDEPVNNKSPNHNTRDPFSPPALAWPGLIATVSFSEKPEENISDKKTHSIPDKLKDTEETKKQKSNVKEKSPNPTNAAKSKLGITPTPPNLEQQNPDSPEYKETLILPSASQEKPEGQRISYTMKEGETILSVSDKFGINSEIIYKENRLTNNDKLIKGKTLTIPIPKAHLYCLKANETLWRVATRYGLPVEILKEINNFNDTTKLVPDQIIVLPVSIDKIINKKF